MKICAISDTHNKYHNLIIPECDLLISAGDYSFRGEQWDVRNFHEWLNKQSAKYIISVQGNHELGVEKDFELSKATALYECPRVHFIDEGLIEIESIKIWCSAVTPWFHNWAWNRHHGEQLQYHWDKIPLDIDILITHGPPFGILDTIKHSDNNLGCPQLLKKVQEIKPDLHFFGHIHSGHGEKYVNGTSFYNVSICDEMYYPSNPITIVDYIKE